MQDIRKYPYKFSAGTFIDIIARIIAYIMAAYIYQGGCWNNAKEPGSFMTPSNRQLS